MNSADLIRTIFEFILVSGVIWGILNEDKLVAFEESVICRIKRKHIKVMPERKTAKIIKPISD